ncbi:MAG: flagellar hook-associated protein FlgK [Pseudomonadota bacterium]
MGSISAALNNATSGLAAASRRADIVSNNIANALTPGYSRREISVSEQIVAGTGAGITIDGVKRANDPAITAERRGADGIAARDQIIATTYSDFNNALGEPDDLYSFFSKFDNLESSLRDLAETPESAPLQNQVLASAKSLVASFNQLSQVTQDTRARADQDIARQVDFVNATVAEIEDLNTQIAALQAGNRDSSGLEDQRKVLIDQVSEIIPVREIRRDFGEVDLMTNEGVFLIAGAQRELEFTPTSFMTAELSYANGNLSGLSIDGVEVTPGQSQQGMTAGTLAGYFAVRDDVAPTFQGQLDSLARDVMERFEGIDATLPAGSPGLFTDAGAAFDAANEVGLAGRIEINAAVDPAVGGEVWRLRDGLGAAAEGPSGSATFIRQMLDSLTELRNAPAGAQISGEYSAAGAAAAVTSVIGAHRVVAETALASSAARAQGLEDAELSAIAVDTDVELAKLIEIEQAFAANARVIQTAEQMLALLMEI